MSKNLKFLGLLGCLLIETTFQTSAQLPNTWIQKSNVGGTVRFGAVSFSIGNKGYIGIGNTVGNTKDFWEYDPSTDIWSQKADFGGTARMFATGLSIGNRGFIACGDDGNYKNDFWEYNPVTNSWTQKADFAGPARTGAVGFSIGSKGYLGIGLLSVSPVVRTNDFWEYDPANDVWTQKSDIGTFVRAFGVGFSIGNKGYIGTGNNGSLLTNDFWEYNPTTDMWIQKADFGGIGRFQAVGIGTDSFGYIGLGDIGGGYTNDFWEYNPALDTWTVKPNFGGQVRTLATGFSISNKVFIGTGTDWLNTIDYDDFWEYTPLCTPPVISSEPINQSLTYGVSAIFTITASDATSYQWQEDSGSGFIDITDGGIYSNATNDTLTISLPTIDMTGYKYRCVITGQCLFTATSDGNATLTVTAMEVMVTPDADQSKEYGSDDPTPFTYTYSPSLLGSDAFSGLLSRSSGEDVGKYVYSTGTLSAGDNYSLSVAPTPTFDITAKTLTIIAENKEKCYDGNTYNGDYTVTYHGLDKSKDQALLHGTLVFSGDAIEATGIGSYTITPSGLTSKNYNLCFVDGTLAINHVYAATIIKQNGDSIISNSSRGNQWYLDDNEIPGATADLYIATENGTYYTVVTEGDCSSTPSNSIVILNVSIKETGAELFDVYPNPSNGVFNIKMKTSGKSLYNLEIYNSLGTLILKQNNAIVDGKNIKLVDLSGQKSGLYTVVLKNRTNSFVKKVFITK